MSNAISLSAYPNVIQKYLGSVSLKTLPNILILIYEALKNTTRFKLLLDWARVVYFIGYESKKYIFKYTFSYKFYVFFSKNLSNYIDHWMTHKKIQLTMKLDLFITFILPDCNVYWREKLIKVLNLLQNKLSCIATTWCSSPAVINWRIINEHMLLGQRILSFI